MDVGRGRKYAEQVIKGRRRWDRSAKAKGEGEGKKGPRGSWIDDRATALLTAAGMFYFAFDLMPSEVVWSCRYVPVAILAVYRGLVKVRGAGIPMSRRTFGRPLSTLASPTYIGVRHSRRRSGWNIGK